MSEALTREQQRRITELAALVDRTLSERVSRLTGPSMIRQGMRYCLSSGGKRFRPLLCLGGCEAVGADPHQALTVACAIELIHTYSLVHDDLPAMDNADQRRGQPSCHQRFGEGNAILIGDALLTLAFEWLSHHHTPHPIDIIQVLTRACGTDGLIGGQALDVECLDRPHTSTAWQLRAIAQRKTASLIIASIVAGALAGGATTEQRAALERYGASLGMAFQVIDDLHDHDGLAKMLGVEDATQEAQQLLAQAMDALARFGAKAAFLRAMVVWLGATR